MLHRRGEIERIDSGWGAKTPRAWRMLEGLWMQMKGQAIERAAGLA